MKKIVKIAGINACALLMATTTFAAGHGRRSGHRYGYQQTNENQNMNTNTRMRRNFTDNDNDGINDNRGMKQGQGKRYGIENGSSNDKRQRPP